MTKGKTKITKKFKEQFASKILKVFEEYNERVFTYKQVCALIGVNDKPTRGLVIDLLEMLQEEGRIRKLGKGRFQDLNGQKELKGSVDMIRSGGAFIISDASEADIYIAPKHMNGAMHGDIVSVVLKKPRGGRSGKPEGKILEILEPGNREFVGVLEVSSKYAFLIPDSNNVPFDVFIPKGHFNGAKHGDKVVGLVKEWPKGDNNPVGRIKKVLGRQGDDDAEMNSILTEYGLPYEFPDKVLYAAEDIKEKITQKEIDKRKDFRDKLTFTIDPDDAKDFDDALSIIELENGNWEIGIHIADVSHYVTVDSIIDKEAVKRGTSVYLADRVVPMLPEKLSNKVCSLRPEEEKLTFSAVFEMDNDANLIKEWFGRTVICSNKRFTYNDAQKILEEKDGLYKTELDKLNSLAKKLRKKRVEKGAMEFSSSEVKFIFDDDGFPIDVFVKVMKDANQLIEDFMLLANKKVAKLFDPKNSKKGQPKKFIYRIHDKPAFEKLELLAKFVSQFDYKLALKENGSNAKAINKMLEHFAGKAEKDMIEQVAIRSMAKAEYNTDNIGHYGLAFEHYSHFTSPIRRYPDLAVHRLLSDLLTGQNGQDVSRLELICKHSSSMERKAVDAERASSKFKQVQFMMNKVGEEFIGIVSGITDWGIFVELVESKCEGMISLRDMDDNSFSLDEKNYQIVSASGDIKIRLGDKMKVKLAKANLNKRQLDFILVSTDVEDE